MFDVFRKVGSIVFETCKSILDDLQTIFNSCRLIDDAESQPLLPTPILTPLHPPPPPPSSLTPTHYSQSWGVGNRLIEDPNHAKKNQEMRLKLESIGKNVGSRMISPNKPLQQIQQPHHLPPPPNVPSTPSVPSVPTAPPTPSTPSTPPTPPTSTTDAAQSSALQPAPSNVPSLHGNEAFYDPVSETVEGEDWVVEVDEEERTEERVVEREINLERQFDVVTVRDVRIEMEVQSVGVGDVGETLKDGLNVDDEQVVDFNSPQQTNEMNSIDKIIDIIDEPIPQLEEIDSSRRFEDDSIETFPKIYIPSPGPADSPPLTHDVKIPSHRNPTHLDDESEIKQPNGSTTSCPHIVPDVPDVPEVSQTDPVMDHTQSPSPSLDLRRTQRINTSNVVLAEVPMVDPHSIPLPESPNPETSMTKKNISDLNHGSTEVLQLDIGSTRTTLLEHEQLPFQLALLPSVPSRNEIPNDTSGFIFPDVIEQNNKVDNVTSESESPSYRAQEWTPIPSTFPNINISNSIQIPSADLLNRRSQSLGPMEHTDILISTDLNNNPINTISQPVTPRYPTLDVVQHTVLRVNLGLSETFRPRSDVILGGVGGGGGEGGEDGVGGAGGGVGGVRRGSGGWRRTSGTRRASMGRTRGRSE